MSRHAANLEPVHHSFRRHHGRDARASILEARRGSFHGVAATVWVWHSLPLADAPGRLLNAGPILALAFVPFLFTLSFDVLGFRTLLLAAGARTSFGGLLRVRLEAEAAGLLLPSAGLVPEIVALRALSVEQRVPVAQGLASLAARRFAMIQAHGVVMALGTSLLFAEAASMGSRGLCALLATAALLLVAIGQMGPRWLLSPSLADRAQQSLARLPGQRLRLWAERHRHEFARSGRSFAKIARAPRALAWSAGLAFVLTFFAEAFESFVILRLLGSPLSFGEALSFDSAVSLARSLVAFVPAGLGVQEAGYAVFLLGAASGDAGSLVASFVVLKRLKEALYCALGLTLLTFPPLLGGKERDEPTRAGPLRLRLAQPDHPDA